jgi:DnaK suppressor protein
MAQKAPAKKPAAAKKPAPAGKAAATKKAAKPTAAAKSAPAKSRTQTARPSAAAAPAARPTAPVKPAPVRAKESTPPVKPPAAVAKPVAKAAAEAVATSAVATAAPTLLVPAPPPRKPSKAASKYAVAQAPIPLPPPTSRFADRFAPPRPPTRQMNNVELDVVRHTQKSDPKLANAWKSKAGRDLTEAELLAMPESEYMNEKQLDFFRAKLQHLKDDLLSNAGETTEHLREDTSIVPDPADRATIEEEHALELRTRDRERKLLKKISQSLARLDSGDYGFCDETGEPIGLGRLIARPTATLSLEAQQRRELKQKMFGD